MTLAEQVYAQAVLMAGSLEAKEDTLLQVLSKSACAALTARLRSGITPEDCKADFIAAASLFALAAMTEVMDGAGVESFTAGDLTVRRSGGGAAASCLRYQANLMIMPYTADDFSFMGV